MPTRRACPSRWGGGGGLPALKATINDRLAENVDDDAIYLLIDGANQVLAGNLAEWPRNVAHTEISYELMIRRAGISGMARVQRL